MARILVVDDDSMIRLVVKSILERQSHSVVLAECGHEGAEAIEAYAFDVAIVDIFMPDMNGIETIKVFRRSAPALPIIVMSGYAFRHADGAAQDFFRTATDLGATACLHKPFTPSQLLHAVKVCMTPAASASEPRCASGSGLDHDLGRGAA